MNKILKIATAVALSSTILVANAANVNLSKLRINLNKTTLNESLNVINQNKEDNSSVQVELKKWTQKQKEDNTVEEVFEDTDSIIVSPKTTVIPPDTAKSIRVLVDEEDVAEKDYSYRLFIQELPKEKKSDMNSISVLFKFSIPVFYYSGEMKKFEKMNISVSPLNESDKKYILIENKDNQHIQVLNILNAEESKKFEANKTLIFDANIQNGYLLPNLKNKYLLKDGNEDFSTFTIITDKGSKVFTNNK